MEEIAKLYFQYQCGTDDFIMLEADSVEEMNTLIDGELSRRGAIFTGIEWYTRMFRISKRIRTLTGEGGRDGIFC